MQKQKHAYMTEPERTLVKSSGYQDMRSEFKKGSKSYAVQEKCLEKK